MSPAVSAEPPGTLPASPAPAARRYRDVTEHSPESIRASRYQLDWANRPTLYRTYAGAETVALPPPKRLTRPALDVITAAVSLPADGAPAINLETLSTILLLSGGIIEKRPSGGDIRATAAAGALYPNEWYVVSGALPHLPAGVYHYDPKRVQLSRLRDGDWRAVVAKRPVRRPFARRLSP